MMKRIALCIILLIAMLPLAAVAQTHYESNVAIGVKAGTTLSRMSFTPTVPQTMLLGTTVGVSLRYIEERHFGFIVELNMMQRGWKEVFDHTDHNFQRRLTYIHLPFLTHIYFGSHRFRGFFNAGPEVALMIGDSYDANFDINNLPDFQDIYRETTQFASEVQTKFDYGISAGLGMEFILKNRHSFVLEGRYYFGIGNIFGNSKADYFAASRGMSISITLGYMFRLK